MWKFNIIIVAPGIDHRNIFQHRVIHRELFYKQRKSVDSFSSLDFFSFGKLFVTLGILEIDRKVLIFTDQF